MLLIVPSIIVNFALLALAHYAMWTRAVDTTVAIPAPMRRPVRSHPEPAAA